MAWTREIEHHPNGLPRQVSSLEVIIPDSVVLGIFGPRVFDAYKKVWIEDDFEVVWPRQITADMVDGLKPYLPETFVFDLEHHTYYFSTFQ